MERERRRAEKAGKYPGAGCGKRHILVPVLCILNLGEARQYTDIALLRELELAVLGKGGMLQNSPQRMVVQATLAQWH